MMKTWMGKGWMAWLLLLCLLCSTALAETLGEQEAKEFALERFLSLCEIPQEEQGDCQVLSIEQRTAIGQDDTPRALWDVTIAQSLGNMELRWSISIFQEGGEIAAEDGAVYYQEMRTQMDSIVQREALRQAWEAERGLPSFLWSLEDQQAFFALVDGSNSDRRTLREDEITLEEAERISREALKAAYGEDVENLEGTRAGFTCYENVLSVQFFYPEGEDWGYRWQVNIDLTTGQVSWMDDNFQGNG